MRVLHVVHTDSDGGGAIGAYRLHQAMLSQEVDSKMLVIRKRRHDKTVIRAAFLVRLLVKIGRTAGVQLLKLQRSRNTNFRSLNLFPTGIHRQINNYKPDIVQFHWVNRNTISIREITRINAPVVWKLPDMWAFCGSEHYLLPGSQERYRQGYSRANRLLGDVGLDIDKWVWRYKQWAWRNATFAVAAPSKWLAKCASDSVLFGQRKIVNIANPIDLDRFQPLKQKNDARIILGLPQDKKLILFGSYFAKTDSRKGYHHLQEALELLGDADSKEYELVVFGTVEEGMQDIHGIRAHMLGTITDERLLIAVYIAADVMVLPTEADNLPNTIQEATACGTPCVGFNIGGMPDMVAHKDTGYLATPFDAAELAEGLKWVLANTGDNMTGRVRDKACVLFSQKDRVADYIDLYNEMIIAHSK